MAKSSVVAAKPLSHLYKPGTQAPPTRAQQEQEQEDREYQEAQRKIDDRNRARVDRISKLLESKTYLVDAMPTQVIPRGDLEKREYAKPGYLQSIPKWRFSRFYIAEKIVVDLFVDDRSYKEADVEARRAWCRAEGLRYGALGPMDNTLDLVPQLEIPVEVVKPTVAKTAPKKVKAFDKLGKAKKRR